MCLAQFHNLVEYLIKYLKMRFHMICFNLEQITHWILNVLSMNTIGIGVT